jgi:hypothetical protein
MHFALTEEEQKQLAAYKAVEKEYTADKIRQEAMSDLEVTAEATEQFSIYDLLPASGANLIQVTQEFVKHVARYLFGPEIKSTIKFVLNNFLQTNVKVNPMSFCYGDIINKAIEYSKTHTEKETKNFVNQLADEMLAYDKEQVEAIKNIANLM